MYRRNKSAEFQSSNITLIVLINKYKHKNGGMFVLLNVLVLVAPLMSFI